MWVYRFRFEELYGEFVRRRSDKEWRAQMLGAKMTGTVATLLGEESKHLLPLLSELLTLEYPEDTPLSP